MNICVFSNDGRLTDHSLHKGRVFDITGHRVQTWIGAGRKCNHDDCMAVSLEILSSNSIPGCVWNVNLAALNENVYI